MRNRASTGHGHGITALLLILILSCAAFSGLKLRTDLIPRKKIPGSSIIYIPSGKSLRFATFGYSSVAADVIYIWAIQYYSDDSIPDRFKYLDHIFSIISDLDPGYRDPYEVGALIAVAEAQDIDLAFKILDRGLERNPDQWIFPFEAASFAQMTKKDFELARVYYKKAMDIKGSPDLIKRLYANAAFRSMDFKTAWDTWLEVYNTAKEDWIKKIASNHLYQVKAAVDIQAIELALAKFKEKSGHTPPDLAALVRDGFMAALPKDLDGKDYVYDPQTGKVQSATIPWKR
jgi:tetratricopeptide (TPR) repeat protein